MSETFQSIKSELWQALLALSALFFVVDPIGVLPVFVSMTPQDPPLKRRAMALKACWVAAALLFVMALAGGVLFRLLGVTLPAFKVAGGLALVLSGIDMLRGQNSKLKTSPEEQAEGQAKDDVAVFPLAMPLLAGPGAIATVMLLMGRAEGIIAEAGVMLSIAVTMAASYLVLRTAEYTDRWMSETVKTIIVRVMGLLLVAIAVQFAIEGTVEVLRTMKVVAQP
jgi:multiple antibiotic resistance protein